MKSSKKGVSPVIAVVLLIALALVLASIVFIWAKSFISEQIEKNGQSIDQVCKEVSFNVDSIRRGDVLEIQLVNTGNIPIYDFDIKFISGGDSTMNRFELGADVGSSSVRRLIPISGTDRLVLYPIVLGNIKDKTTNKAVSCLNDGKAIAL